MGIKVSVYVRGEKMPVLFEASEAAYTTTYWVSWYSLDRIRYTFRHKNVLYFTEKS